MPEFHVHLDFYLSPRGVKAFVTAVLVVASASKLDSENVTLTTYYPAPSGVYTKMITTNNTFLARDGGFVGVGTGASVPVSKLQVRGDLAFEQQGALAAGRALPGGATMIWNDGDYLRLNQNMDLSTPVKGVLTPFMVSTSLNVGGAGTFGNPGSGGAWIKSKAQVGCEGGPCTTVEPGRVDVAAGTFVSNQACTIVPFGAGGFTPCNSGSYATYSEGIWSRNIIYSGPGQESGTMFCCPRN